jgi:Domain of unknown function (DUF4124)
MSGKSMERNLWIAVTFIVVMCTIRPIDAAQVYECKVNGQRIFSDQPCAADAAKREITVENTMSAREANIGSRSSTPQKAKSNRQRKTDVDDADDKRQARCQKLSGDKQTINSKLRAGYNNNQGERLRDRLRKVDNEYYDLRCSSLR